MPTTNPSVHYLGIVGTAGQSDHARCAAQWDRIKAERADEYGPQGAYNHGGCVHGQRFEGRGWDRDGAANGQQGGVDYNPGSRSLCVMVGTDDPIPAVCVAMVDAWYREALSRGMDVPLRPHSSFVATQCPGDNLRVVIDQINAQPDTGDDDWMAMFTDKEDFGRFLDLHIKKVLDSEGTGIGQPSWGHTVVDTLATVQSNHNDLDRIIKKVGA